MMIPSYMCQTTEAIIEDLRLRLKGKQEQTRTIKLGPANRRNSRFGGLKFNRARRQRP